MRISTRSQYRLELGKFAKGKKLVGPPICKKLGLDKVHIKYILAINDNAQRTVPSCVHVAYRLVLKICLNMAVLRWCASTEFEADCNDSENGRFPSSCTEYKIVFITKSITHY